MSNRTLLHIRALEYIFIAQITFSNGRCIIEIEAKFILSDRETFRNLEKTGHLASYALADGQVQQVQDTYLDTAERQILAAGYACRRRERPGGTLITLKALKGAEGAIHRREELQVPLPSDVPLTTPNGWPESPVRERVLQLIGDAELVPLFSLQQKRTIRPIRQDDRVVAKMSLDDVCVTVDGREQAYRELEIELEEQGAEDDLATLAAYLQEEWHLEPATRSKFERGLAFVEGNSSAGELLLPEERAILRQVVRRDDLHGRKADGLLALDEGLTQAEAGERAGRTARTVRRWLADFREERLSIFPDRILEEARAVPAPTAPETPPEAVAEPETQGAEDVKEVEQAEESEETAEAIRPLALETLFEQYDVDRAHARAVADRALALFDYLSSVHGLPPERRSLLEMAALVHNVGLESDPDRHHKVGRDILLEHPPAELDGHERSIVAVTTFLHRKHITPKKLRKLSGKALFADLSPSLQDEALVLAALVRMADGLDYSQTGTSELGEVQDKPDTVEIELAGPYSAVEADQAQKKSDLWHELFEVGVQFISTQPTMIRNGVLHLRKTKQQAVPAAAELPEHPGLDPDDSMAEAARKTLNFHFQRMLYHEPGTRLGEDIEELHDMRVATRRMRAAFQVFGDYLDMQRLKSIFKDLRRTGRVLGAVRDLDVFWDKTEIYLADLPPDHKGDLDPLRQVWEAEREKDREKMLAYLDSDRYARFTERFADFLQTPGAGALPKLTRKGEALPHRLRHVVPVAVYERLAEVLAYDEWVTKPEVPLERLHRLRIAAKRLRYSLEFFEEVLGPEASGLIKDMKRLQDHLGDLQDAVVASGLLRDFLTWGTWGHSKSQWRKASPPSEPVVAPGVATYLATRQNELQDLLDTFPQVWTYFQGPEFRQSVALAIAPL